MGLFSTKNTTEIRLPELLRPAQSFLAISNKFKSDPFVSYFAGIYAIEISLNILFEKKQDQTLTEEYAGEIQTILSKLMTIFEKKRSYLSKSKSGIDFQDDQEARKYLNKFTASLYDKVIDEVDSGNASGKTITKLVDVSVLYEMLRGLYPYSISDFERTVSEHKFLESNCRGGSNKAGREMPGSQIHHEVYKLDSIKSDNNDKSLELEVTKQVEDADNAGYVDESQKSKLQLNGEDVSKDRDIPPQIPILTDAEIYNRIEYCKFQSTRILHCIKMGQNPNEEVQNYKSPNEKVSQKEIDDVLKHVLETPDNIYDNTELSEESSSSTSDEACDDISGSESDSNEISFPAIPAHKPRSTFDSENQTNNQDEEDKTESGIDKMSDSSEGDTYNVDKKEVQNHHQSATISPFLTKKSIDLYINEEELLQSASKSAKFAISALNYEDADTALSELMKAIDSIKEYKARISKDGSS